MRACVRARVRVRIRVRVRVCVYVCVYVCFRAVSVSVSVSGFVAESNQFSQQSCADVERMLQTDKGEVPTKKYITFLPSSCKKLGGPPETNVLAHPKAGPQRLHLKHLEYFSRGLTNLRLFPSPSRTWHRAATRENPEDPVDCMSDVNPLTVGSARGRGFTTILVKPGCRTYKMALLGVLGAMF